MYENTSIANQLQSAPAAAADKTTQTKQKPEFETALNEKLPIQLKLSVGAVNDPLEHQADAMADKVMRMPETSFVQRKAAAHDPSDYDDEHVRLKPQTSEIDTFIQRSLCAACDDEHVRLKPLASQVTPFIQAKGDGAVAASDAVSGKIKSSMGGGSPMQTDTRNFMESRFGADFSDVKIHNGGESADLNRSLNAKAFTISNNIYFNNGQYRPETESGKHLLAHELTHVIQQKGKDSAGKNMQRKTHIQRQPAAPAPLTPGFSVNQAAYVGLINSAFGQMSGNLVDSETLAPVILPIVRAMLASVAWKDASGAVTGGGVIQYALPGGTNLNLRLILNDGPSPLLAGEFTSRGLTNGEMEIFIQKNPTDAELGQTIYHEAMHLLSWLINRTPPAISLRSSARGPGQAGGVGTLDQSHWAQALSTIHMWLDTLATSVNGRRAAGARITPADITRMTSWLFDEVNVRIETEVLSRVQTTQQNMHTRGPLVTITPGPNWQINSPMVDHYVFDLSRVFVPGDRAGLTPTDQQTLATLMQIMEGLFQSRVARRFNSSPYLIGRGIPRAPFQYTPPPLVPPSSFGPPILP